MFTITPRFTLFRLSVLALFCAGISFVAMFTLAVQGGIDGIAGIDPDHGFAATRPLYYLMLWALVGLTSLTTLALTGFVLGRIMLGSLRLCKKIPGRLGRVSNVGAGTRVYAAASLLASTSQFSTVSGDDTP